MKLVIWSSMLGSNFSPFSIYQGIINNYSYIYSWPKEKALHTYKIPEEKWLEEYNKHNELYNCNYIELSWESDKVYEGYTIWNEGSFMPVLEDHKTETLYTIKEAWENDEHRYNVDLIALVEAYGELVGAGAKVIEIPDGIAYDIYQPDGCGESVHEKHRIWS